MIWPASQPAIRPTIRKTIRLSIPMTNPPDKGGRPPVRFCVTAAAGYPARAALSAIRRGAGAISLEFSPARAFARTELFRLAVVLRASVAPQHELRQTVSVGP